MSSIKGVYNDSLSALSAESDATLRETPNRALHVNLRNQSGTEMGTVSNPLQIAGSIAVGGTTDEAGWTAGVSTFTSTGGAFNDSAAALTSGQQGTARFTANRALHVNLRDHLGNEATFTGNSLNVNITGGGAAGGTSATDEAAATAGSSSFTPIGGVFNDTFTALTSGQMGLARLTSTRALHVSVDNATLAVTQSAGPWTSNITQFGGTNLSTGTGTGGAGIPRVTVSNDSNILATQSGTWNVGQTGAPWSQNLTQFGGTNVSTGTGVSGAGIPRVTVSNDSNILATQSGTWSVRAQDGSGNSLSSTTGALNVNVQNASLPVTQSGVWTFSASVNTSGVFGGGIFVQPGASTSLQTDYNGKLLTSQIPQETINVVQPDMAVQRDWDDPAPWTTTLNKVDSSPVDIGYGSAQDGTLRVSAAQFPRGLVTQGSATISNTTETVILPVKSGYQDLTTLVITNTSATAVRADIRDSIGGVVLFSIGLAANGGAIMNQAQVPVEQRAATNGWTIQMSASVTDIRVFMQAVSRV